MKNFNKFYRKYNIIEQKISIKNSKIYEINKIKKFLFLSINLISFNQRNWC